MNSTSAPNLTTYTLFSIGERRGGKTVFLAATYATLRAENRHNNPQQLWFDSEDSEAKKRLESVLSYVARTSQYPPATLKITNFDFSLKYYRQEQPQTMCRFRWWDTPGESCEFHNPAFQVMVLNSDGYCIFLNAPELVEKFTQGEVEPFFELVKSIAELVCQNDYQGPFALILTRCDLIASNSLNKQHLKAALQPLTTQLERMGINYRLFYSEIPIVSLEGVSTLKKTQAATAIFWLLQEINKVKSSPAVRGTEVQENRKIIAPDPNLTKGNRGGLWQGQIFNLQTVMNQYALLLLLLLIIIVIGIFSISLFKSEQQYREQPIPTKPN